MRLFRNFRAVTICSAVLSVAGSMLGLLLSILFSTPIGATVVVIHVILFGIFSAVNAIRGNDLQNRQASCLSVPEPQPCAG